MPKRPPAENPIDAMMDRASLALERTSYFECERVCAEALRRAAGKHDFERMARICLPLQEARRQKRQLAIDAESRILITHSGMIEDGAPPLPGCYLFCPPLIAADARAFRQRADAAQSPVLVLTREPLTRDGRWPVVSVGVVSVRIRIAPPFPVTRVETSRTKDDGEQFGAPAREWFERVAEELGDEAIRKINREDPAAHRVEDLVELLDAFPDHEKLHQALMETCREAAGKPLPLMPRRRARVDDPYSF